MVERLKNRILFSMFRYGVYLNIFFYILLVQSSETIELFDRLDLLANYFYKNMESRTPDAMLGVYLCKGIEFRFVV